MENFKLLGFFFFLFKDLALYNREFKNSKKKKKKKIRPIFFHQVLGLKHVSNVRIIFLLLNEMMLSTVP